MKNQQWTKDELRLLEEWDWVKRFIETQIPGHVAETDTLRYLMIEARLLMANKLVIIYRKNQTEPEEILSFREFLSESEKADNILFHPINFKNYAEYSMFLNQVREQYFSMLN